MMRFQTTRTTGGGGQEGQVCLLGCSPQRRFCMNMSGLVPLRNGCRIPLSALLLRAQDSWPFFFKRVSSHLATHVITSIWQHVYLSGLKGGSSSITPWLSLLVCNLHKSHLFAYRGTERGTSVSLDKLHSQRLSQNQGNNTNKTGSE